MAAIQEQIEQDENDDYISGDVLLESVFELAFGDDALNKDYSNAEVLAKLREFSDLALKVEEHPNEDQTMKNYLVKLNLMIGSYEKLMPHVIEAEDADAAVEQALRNESHNEVDRVYDEDAEWWDDDMIYQLYEVKEITVFEFTTLRLLGI